jgi:hypothetical protein
MLETITGRTTKCERRDKLRDLTTKKYSSRHTTEQNVKQLNELLENRQCAVLDG